MRQLPRKSQLNQVAAQQGVVLLEALVSLLILSLGILALVGLQARMVQNTTQSKVRADASYFAQQQIGQLWANPSVAADRAIEDATENERPALAALPGGRMTIQAAAGGQFTIMVGWTLPGEVIPANNPPCGLDAAHCFTTTATIAGADDAI